MGGVYRIQTFLFFYIFFIFTRPLNGTGRWQRKGRKSRTTRVNIDICSIVHEHLRRREYKPFLGAILAAFKQLQYFSRPVSNHPIVYS